MPSAKSNHRAADSSWRAYDSSLERDALECGEGGAASVTSCLALKRRRFSLLDLVGAMSGEKWPLSHVSHCTNWTTTPFGSLTWK
jgi:hypothetical protein